MLIIMDKLDYISEMNHILSDVDTYQVLQNNPTNVFKRELDKLVAKGFSSFILNKKEKAYLVPAAPRIPAIYHLPKIHKDPLKPPGRPIVSGIDSITSQIGRYIDYYLQPLVKLTPSYLKDTTSTIQLLEGIDIKGDYLLATVDVALLYTCIPQQLGVQAVTHFLDQDHSITDVQKAFIVELLEFATTHNYFWFNQNFFLQKRGVAMGAKFAPSLANLFMAKLEEDVVYFERNPSLVLWARYIDNVLLLWDDSSEALGEFFFSLNNNYLGLSFSFDCSPTKVNFLDLEIELKSRQFKFQTHFKTTDRNSFIPTDSQLSP